MKKVLLATLFSVFAMSSMAADLHPTCEEFLKMKAIKKIKNNRKKANNPWVVSLSYFGCQ